MYLQSPPDSAAARQAFEKSHASAGYVMNLAHAWAWRPDLFIAFADLRARLTGATALTSRDQALIVCATASARGDAYCALAWGQTLAAQAGADLAAAVIAGPGEQALSERDRAIAGWARQVAADPNACTAADVEGLRALGLGDREIFEATLLVAFRLAFSTVNAALGVHPDLRLALSVPPQVRAAVSFGREPGETP